MPSACVSLKCSGSSARTIGAWSVASGCLTKSAESEALSADLAKRGAKFVGPVIMYSFMQAVGMIDDHDDRCPQRTKPT